MEAAKSFMNRYFDSHYLKRDPRTLHFPMMDEPMPVVSIIILYLLTVYWGPRIMQNRKPLQLNTYMKIYNIIQIIFCGCYVFVAFTLTELTPNGIFLMCKKFDREVNLQTRTEVCLHYANFICRLVELSETIVHIIRKKTQQISYLHVVHHALNVMLAWVSTAYQPGGSSTTILLINFSIHIVMYSYYFMALQKNAMAKKLTQVCKKYITMMQLVQFFLMMTIIMQDLVLVPQCFEYTLVHPAGFAVILINIILFFNFYKKSYNNKAKIQ